MRTPFLFVLVEVLQDLVEQATPLHRDRPRLVHQPGMVVVPVQAWALEIVVQRRGAEVIDLHRVRVAARPVRLERLT